MTTVMNREFAQQRIEIASFYFRCQLAVERGDNHTNWALVVTGLARDLALALRQNGRQFCLGR
jgi:hypothetical protein